MLAALVYVGSLFAWYGVHRLVGDASPLLYSFNAVALYFFCPCPYCCLLRPATRRWEVAGGFVAGAAALAAPLGRPLLAAGDDYQRRGRRR